MGTQQSGILNLKVADIVKDNEILKTARYYAIRTLKEDPQLQLEQNRAVAHAYRQIVKHKNIWTYIS